MSIDAYRLPRTARPSHYALLIDPDLAGTGFTGTVTITAEVTESTGVISLNADGLTITRSEIRVGSGPPQAARAELDAETQRLHLHVAAPIDPGPITVELDFTGRYNEQLVGLYLSEFETDGVPRRLATTQFEPTQARGCFPCWDEPDLKASFELTIVTDADHTAVANSAEVARRIRPDGRQEIQFAPTMVMSSYLVAFIVGPLEITEPVDVDGVPLRVVHVPGRGHLTSFALDVGAFALRYFSDYFAIPYPGDKLDLVAVPDFAFGAMENLGCVTFREAVLLLDPASATQDEIQRVTDVISHEIAHMWFGDLVTMTWWNGLWLNEAFATFMETRCTDAYAPSWERWVDFNLSRAAAFDIDALSSTRSIEYEVISPADADGMFNVLTYEKGAAVVRMLEQYLGEERFRDGIRLYMNRHQFGNADTTDLWDAIEEATGEPVRRIMDSWIFQGGFPLISYQVEDRQLRLVQEPMAYTGTPGDRAAADPDTPDRAWAVPARFRWASITDAGAEAVTDRLLIETEPAVTTLPSRPDWLVANAGSTGFYRVAHSAEQLEALTAVAVDHLTPTERFSLVDDAHAAVLADRLATPTFLTLIESMGAEDDRSVWQRLISGLHQLDRLVDGRAREILRDISHDLLAPPLANLGLSPRDGDDSRTRQLRGDLVRALGVLANDPEIQEEAKLTVSVLLREPELVDAALSAASIDVVASLGDAADFDTFVAGWRNASTPQQELRFLYALGDFADPELTERRHRLILDGDIRAQNAPFLLGRSLAGRETGAATWRFITEHWDHLLDAFAGAHMVRMLQGLPRLDQPGQPEAAAAFFADHTVPSSPQTLAQILEKQQVQAALRQRETGRLTMFLEAADT
ncbi:MAG: M1 family metallopeptidase [Acidimicrobiales bacterium]